MNKSFAAFTVLEFIVAMVITAVLVTLAYAALGLFQQKVIPTGDRDHWPEALTGFQYHLKKDIDRCSWVELEEDRLILWSKNGEGAVEYYYQDHQIVRSAMGLHDTLVFSGCEQKHWLKGQEVGSGRLDRLQWDLEQNGRAVSLIGFKEYAAVDIIGGENNE